MNARRHVLLTVQLPEGEATVAAAAKALGIEPDLVDAGFGVVLVDPATRRHAVLVDERCVPSATSREGVEGPFANPRIEPFDARDS